MKKIELKRNISYFSLSIWLLLCFFSRISAFETKKESVQNFEKDAEMLNKQWSSDSYRRSIELFSMASEAWKKLNNFQNYSKCLRETAKIYLKLNEFDNASRQLNKALELDGKNNYWEARTEDLSLLSLVYLRAGKVKESKKLYKQALQLSQNSENPSIRAISLFSAAQYNYFYGNADETIKLFQETLSFAEQANDKILIAQSLLYIGYTNVKLGKTAISLENAQKALAIWEEIDDVRGKAICYVGLGFIHTMTGQYQDALRYYKKGEELFPNDFEWLEKGRLFNGLATIYEEYHQFKLAENYRLKALECFKKSKYLYGQLATLPTLANDVYLNGNFDAAKTYYGEALTLAYSLKDVYHLAYIKKDLGEIYLENNLSDKAIENFLEVEKIYQKLATKFPIVYELIGKAYFKKSDLINAHLYFKQSFQIAREVKEISTESESLFNLAQISAIENNPDEALKIIQESLRLTENLYSDTDNTNFKSTYFSNVFDRYELYINLLIKMHKQSPNENYAIEALQAAEKSRARSILENLSLAEADFTKDALPEIVKREKEIRVSLNSKADKLTDLLSGNAAKSETDNLDNEINELNNELENIKADLKQKSPMYSAIKNPAPFDVGEFQKNILDDNSLLLEFSFGKDESYLWCVGKNEFSSYILPPRVQIETIVEKLRGLIASREMKQGEAIEDYQKRMAEAEADYQSGARELSNLLFGQIADKLSNKRLIIVPDGKLHYFPVAALPLPNSESNDPILLTNETVYEPSAQTLLLLEKSRRQSAATKNLLVFSDPIFTTDDARFSPENKPVKTAETTSADKFRFVESLNSLMRLTASKDESDSIVSIVGATESDVYSGFAANREQLLNIKAEDYKILHFATHGFTDEQRPELSGIILSRFDEQGQKLDESFRIHDIYGLNLNADLVVLSACETGIGKEVKGEGLMSLNNAFLQTGAKSVMASLWKVEDGATLELMKNIYGAMAGANLTPSQALRQAQIKLRRNPQYQSPFYWAAFTVQGDFRNVPKITRSSINPFYFLTIPILIFLGFYLFRKKIAVTDKVSY